jgi:hypothetical protein
MPGQASAKPSQGKLAVIGLIGFLVVIVLGAGLVKMTSSGSGGPASATTIDPKAPKPMGQVVTGDKSTSSSPTGTGSPNVSHPKATDGWVTYQAPDGTFQIDFPGQVHTSSDQRPVGGQQLVELNVSYEVGTEGGGFSATQIDLSSASLFPDSQAAFDRLNESGEIKMNLVGPFDVDGKKGVHYTLDVRGKQLLGVLLLNGKRVYLLEAVDVSDVDFSKFVYSFHVSG